MLDALSRLRNSISTVYLGDPRAVDRVIRCLLARGHLLIEDVPGVGKTVLATALARSIDCHFTRIQLTPDMMPADVLGVSIYDKGTGEFTFKKGPIFANIVLADEINRTPPRTQAALLEAMGDGTVSIDGRVYTLEGPFMVVATQNPFDFEGTYLLPENQLDRFLMRVKLGYPTPEQEARVLDLRPSAEPLHTLAPVLKRAEILELQERADRVRVSPPLLAYIVAFANATRTSSALQLGLSPRGALALAQATRATALSQDRDYATTEDVIENVPYVCAHRVIPRSSLGASSQSAEDILGSILRGVPAPV